MRVLHLTRDFPPDGTGGISSAVGGLVAASNAAGLACAVISFDSWRPRVQTKVDTAPSRQHRHGLPVWRVRTPGQVAATISELVPFSPTVLHLHDGVLWPAVQALQQRLGRLPICLTTHVLHAEMNRLRGVQHQTMSLAGQEIALEVADLVIAPSLVARDILARDYPALRPRLRSIGLGCEPCLHLPRPRQSVPLALSVGRFSDVKGTAELFQALPELLRRCPDLFVAIIGGNPESPRSERRWLRRLAEAAPDGLRRRVLFPGWIGAAALAGIYRRATVLLAPSWFETFGLAALEAMAHGVPVVGTTGGALPELIGQTGLLGPPRDVQSLVDSTVRLLNDKTLVNRLGAAAVRRARRFFSWREVVDQHVKIYRRLASA